MKKTLPVVLVLALLAAGLGVLLYPTVSSLVNSFNQTQAIQRYAQTVEGLDTGEIRRQWEQARAYNQSLAAQYASGSTTLDQLKQPAASPSIFNVGGVMGHIEIPCIGVWLPVYFGVGESTLKKGIGHIPQTALPIGGKDSHSVLTGHRAMASADLFNDLDQMVLGDMFFLSILDETLAYQVDQIQVVEPEETQALLPVPGEDYITLVTCTPYAVNSHRLLVRGTRIPYSPNDGGSIVEAQGKAINQNAVILLAFLALWLILALILWATRKPKHKGNAPASRRKRGKKGLLLLVVLFLLAGLCLIFTPTLYRHQYRRQAAALFEDYRQERLAPADESLLLQRIHQYNRELYTNGQEGRLTDPFSFEQPNTDLREMGYGQEVFGFLSVDKMNLTLPVYLGASPDNMDKGAAHLTHTSIPVGGEDTNAVVIGHRNLMQAEMFRDIQLLETGDLVVFTNPWEELAYTVTEVEIIQPEEIQRLLIQPGRDMLTLVTCHPRGSNTSRYVVYCDREQPDS